MPKKEKSPEELATEEAKKESKRQEELCVAALESEKRARVNRWMAKGKSRVSHPEHGSVIVPHLSKLAAIENAAEFWKCEVLDIIQDASVDWVPIDDGPVRRPKEFYKDRTEQKTQGGT